MEETKKENYLDKHP